MPKHSFENAELGFRTAGTLAPQVSLDLRASSRALAAASHAWFVVMVTGQLLFLSHIALFYSRAAASGDLSLLNKTLARGFQPGDTLGNTVLALHLAMAGLLTFGGSLQLLPQIRAVAPRFHRWLGRAYVTAALLGAGSALWLSMVRQLVPGTFWDHLAVNLNGILILLFAGLAFYFARARDIERHRAFAMRLFLVVSGVWFYRLLLFFWLFVNGGHPVGFDPKRFEGPVLTLFSFSQCLLPLAVLQLYFTAKRSSHGAWKLATAGLIGAFTLIMAGGILAYGMYLIHEGTLL